MTRYGTRYSQTQNHPLQCLTRYGTRYGYNQHKYSSVTGVTGVTGKKHPNFTHTRTVRHAHARLRKSFEVPPVTALRRYSITRKANPWNSR